MNIIFFGTSDYCLPILETLHTNFDLKLVVTRASKPTGRKKILTPSSTKIWAEKNNIPVVTPNTLKKDSPDRLELQRKLESIQPDLAIVSDFGLIIPEKIFNQPRLGTLNIHFSNLPNLRGPSPVQFTLLRGELKAWITIFKLENPPGLEIKMDSGPIIWQQNFPVIPNDSTESLYTRLFVEAAKVIPETLNSYEANKIKLIPQDHRKATFCRFLTREDGYIKWETLQKSLSGEDIVFDELPLILREALQLPHQDSQPTNSKSETIFDFYRGVTPWPGMWTLRSAQGKEHRMKILKCHLANRKLILDEVQFEGKNPQKYSN